MIRTCTPVAAALFLLTACTGQVAGQKGHQVDLKTTRDSVSYGIGTDIGHNMRMSGLDSLNLEAVAMGMRDGIDSTEKMTSEKVRSVVQAYMLEAQKKVMAKQQAAGEVNLRKGEAWLTENGKRQGVTTTASGLQYEVVSNGNGPKPTMEDVVSVNYRGTLIDGKEFDSSFKRGQPAQLPVNRWIPGFQEVLQLMPVGSKWKVYIPSNLAYGAQGAGEDIPPYSVLVFDLELVQIMPPSAK